MGVKYFPFSANTDNDWPLLLVPVREGLQVWKHQDDWHLAQIITNAFTSNITPSVTNPGYTKDVGFSLSVGDLNGDHRDDLIICHNAGAGTENYGIYLQQTNGIFESSPAQTYTNKFDARDWLSFLDLNHDGKVDLIKSTWLEEPLFIPGMPSGKVIVGTYLADEHGRFPAEPQAVFRKNDWAAALPVLDLDGDGFPDMVLGYSLLDKEGLRKQVIAKQLDYTLKFYFNRSGSGFPKTSDCQRDVAIHLDQHSLMFGWGQSDSFSHLVNLTGDFNGDGKKDLLVRDHSEHISIYFFVSRERGFNQNADLTFSCPEPIEWMRVADINGDGVSDLIVKMQERDAFRIFTSEGK